MLSIHGIIQARILCSHSLLQGIFSTQGLSPGLLNCRQILYHLNHQGSPVKDDGAAKKENLDPCKPGVAEMEGEAVQM